MSWLRNFNLLAWCGVLGVLVPPIDSVLAQPPKVIRYVDDSATGLNNGSTWANAFTDLHAALQIATSGDEIRVGQGVYKPAPPGGGRAISYVVTDGIELLGGYAGVVAPNPDERDVAVYTVVLSGDLNGNDGASFANTSDNSYHVLVSSGCGPATVIDGFTITAGNANASATPNDRGGGLLNDGGQPTVRNCTFTLNQSPTPASGFGGGVYTANSDAVFMNCAFVGNSAARGGGVFTSGSGQPRIIACRFTGNSSPLGGGLRNNGNSSIVVNCLFIANTANSGGGIYNINTVAAQVLNCTFVGNSGTGRSVHTNLSGGTVAACVVTNCIAWGATGQFATAGGGTNTVTYCDVQGGFAGTGNVNLDPMFVNSADGDYRLQAGSPCLDHGDNLAVPAGITADFNGFPRFWDDPAANMGNPSGAGAITDIGAHERIPDGLFVGAPGGSWFAPNAWPTGSIPTNVSDIVLNVQVLVHQAGAVARSVNVLAGGELMVGNAVSTGSLEVAESIGVEAGGALTLIANGTVTAPALIVQAGATLNIGPGSLLNVHDLTMQTGSTLNWTGGTIRIDGGAWSNPAGSVIGIGCGAATAALELLNGGAATAATVNICTLGEVRGNGTLTAALTNGGSVRPGASPGTLNIAGNYQQTSDGTLHAELASLSPPGTGFDHVMVSGTASIDGTLSVSLIAPFQPAVGDDFAILTSAGGATGAFASVTGSPGTCGAVFAAPVSPAGVMLETNYDDNLPDCNGNDIPDQCDLLAGTSLDCNANSVPDECDIASATSLDCNANAIPDECDIAGGMPDCNTNTVPDSCDIAAGVSADLNTNFVPDECENFGPGDINGDGAVGVDDLLYVINHWGACPTPPLACPGDIAPPGPPAGDGVIDVNDLLMVINNWS